MTKRVEAKYYSSIDELKDLFIEELDKRQIQYVEYSHDNGTVDLDVMLPTDCHNVNFDDDLETLKRNIYYIFDKLNINIIFVRDLSWKQREKENLRND